MVVSSALLRCFIVAVATASMNCPLPQSSRTVEVASNSTLVIADCAAPVFVQCSPDGIDGSGWRWINVSISIVGSSVAGVRCNLLQDATSFDVTNITISLHGCTFGFAMAIDYFVSLGTGANGRASASSASNVSMRVQNSSLQLALITGVFGFTFASLEGVSVALIDTNVSLLSDTTVDVVAFASLMTANAVVIVVRRCRVVVNVTTVDGQTGNPNLAYLMFEHPSAESAADVAVLCESSTVLIAVHALSELVPSVPQPQVFMLRMYSPNGPSVVRRIHLAIVGCSIVFEASENAALLFMFNVWADRIAVSLDSSAFEARCIHGAIFYQRLSAVLYIDASSHVSNVVVKLLNSSVVLEALAGVLSPVYAQENFTGAFAVVVQLNGPLLENVTVELSRTSVVGFPEQELHGIHAPICLRSWSSEHFAEGWSAAESPRKHRRTQRRVRRCFVCCGVPPVGVSSSGCERCHFYGHQRWWRG